MKGAMTGREEGGGEGEPGSRMVVVVLHSVQSDKLSSDDAIMEV